jgi:hypothetical protein
MRLKAAIDNKTSVESFFFSADMQRYYRSQIHLRSLVAELVRRAILKRILNAQAVETLKLNEPLDLSRDRFSDQESHQVTNMVHATDSGFVFYSETLRATDKAGALIWGGPFDVSLWANRHATIIDKLQQAQCESAVPYSLWAEMQKQEALEHVLEAKLSGVSSDSAAVRLPSTADSSASVNVIKEKVSWESVARTQNLGTVSVAFPAQLDAIPNAIPDQWRAFRARFSNASTWSILSQCGVAREIEYNEPFLPLYTVVAKHSALDLRQLWLAQLAVQEPGKAS